MRNTTPDQATNERQGINSKGKAQIQKYNRRFNQI